MYQVLPLNVPTALADTSVRLPINILLALPPILTQSAGSRLFDHPGLFAQLLGRFGWEHSTNVCHPRVWAPAWDDEQVVRFFFGRPAAPPESSPENLRETAPPWQRELRTGWQQPSGPEYDIIHFVLDARQFASLLAREPGFVPEAQGPDPVAEASRAFRAGALRDVLVGSQTRLLILHASDENTGPDRIRAQTQALSLAAYIAGGGGPAVLVVLGSGKDLDDYFLNFYRELLHNRLLSEAARPPAHLDPGVDVRLVLGAEGDQLLRLDRFMDDQDQQLNYIEWFVNHAFLHYSQAQLGLLHRTQWENLHARFEDRRSALRSSISNLRARLNEVRGRVWDHESEGIVPLSQAAEDIAELEGLLEPTLGRQPQLLGGGGLAAGKGGGEEESAVGEWSSLVEEEARQAPRVLNANFADRPEGTVLGPTTALVSGREYSLLVDVGPRWSTIPSLVVGNAEFPEDALPPDEDGHDIQVVVSSDDFEPRLVSGQIRLPSGSGRSTPYIGDQPAARPGPLALCLRAPELGESAGDGPVPARARLCLYYENNLLQSAVVRVGLMRKPTDSLPEPNTVEIDFVLTKGFRDVAQFARRAVRFGPDDAAEGHPIALNLTLNADGSGTHRIRVKGRKELPQGIMSYDPADSAAVLKQARDTLAGCFFLRDEATGAFQWDKDGNPLIGLNPADNSKTVKQFKWDLLKLAEVGSALFNKVFLQVRSADEKQTAAEWVWELNKALADHSVIQVARTAPANYVFPWGMVYEHPLDNPSAYRMCKIVDEEWVPGTTPKVDPLTQTRCKYHGEPGHKKNIICPYGFWGLKHIIEQPPSAVTDLKALDFTDSTCRIVRVQPPINVGVAVSLDTNFDPQRMKAHLNWLGLDPLAFQPPPADSWTSVCTMLQASELVYYFLCHDEWDPAQQDSYLGVGLPSDNAARVYANRLVAFLREQHPEIWKARRPLVFINGCHTADLRPGQVLNFVPAFVAAGASGVIGTEVSVIFPVAVEVGEALLGKLAGGVSVGEAMRAVRWDLARKGNLLGLAYTMYCWADQRFVVGAIATQPIARAAS
jgi:hypothetical protein